MRDWETPCRLFVTWRFPPYANTKGGRQNDQQMGSYRFKRAFHLVIATLRDDSSELPHLYPQCLIFLFLPLHFCPHFKFPSPGIFHNREWSNISHNKKVQLGISGGSLKYLNHSTPYDSLCVCLRHFCLIPLLIGALCHLLPSSIFTRPSEQGPVYFNWLLAIYPLQCLQNHQTLFSLPAPLSSC